MVPQDGQVVYLTTENESGELAGGGGAFCNGSGGEAGERADGKDSSGECHAGTPLDG